MEKKTESRINGSLKHIKKHEEETTSYYLDTKLNITCIQEKVSNVGANYDTRVRQGLEFHLEFRVDTTATRLSHTTLLTSSMGLKYKNLSISSFTFVA